LHKYTVSEACFWIISVTYTPEKIWWYGQTVTSVRHA